MAAQRNSKKRYSPQDDVHDPSLVVATKDDVLFKPLEVGGERVLQFRRLKLEQNIRKWNINKLKTYELDSEEDINYLRGLEPTAWKDQDHYAVIGLKHLRIRASDEDIKKAYRLRVLRHHPDKRMGAGEEVIPECDYFACIVKAFEILSTPAGRNSYDSVDPMFDDYVPPKTLPPGEDFFIVYGKWFQLNSRWSTNPPVPLLGNMLTPRDKVEHFYDYWYNFSSWREYSYLDEEEKEKGQFREERRYIDKQNKQARAKLKKEEMTRIRTAVDNAYHLDPRVKMFKDQDSQKKLDKKLERQKAATEKQELEDKMRQEAQEKARLEKEKIEAEEREKEMAAKKEKETFKKAVKKEKKNFRTVCKSHNYYGLDEKSTLENMETVETLCEILSLNELEQLNQKLLNLSLENGRDVFLENAKEARLKIQAEKEETAKAATVNRNGIASNGTSNGLGDDWSNEEMTLLIKAVNLFPAGTGQRWEVVANFIHQHYADKRKRTAKEVLAKAKDFKSSDFFRNNLKEDANQMAYANFEKNVKTQKMEAEETKRDDETTPVKIKVAPKPTSSDNDLVSQRPWTAEEQKLLEQALKTYPSTHSDRWDRISDCVPGRNKKECMARFKELAALIKAKKSAQKAN